MQQHDKVGRTFSNPLNRVFSKTKMKPNISGSADGLHEVYQNKLVVSPYRSPALRSRSTSLAEKLIKSEGYYQFEIPNLTPPLSPPEIRKRSRTLVEDIDLSLYNGLKEESADELQTAMISEKESKKNGGIGKVKYTVKHCKRDHKILIEILDVEISAHPSSFIKGSTWVIKPVCKIEIRKIHQSPTEARKTSIFQSISAQKCEHIIAVIGTTYELPFKHKTPSHFVIRITLYDMEWNHNDLAIGYIHQPVEDFIQSRENVEVTREIVQHSGPHQTLHGELITKWKWNPCLNTIALDIISANNLKTSSSHHGKELYVKICVFIGDEELHDDYKSELAEVSSNVTFNNQNFKLQIVPPYGIHEMNILIKVIEKHFMSYNCVGQTLIGPYMIKTIENNTLSCWEKMIIDPNKEVIYNAELTL